MTTKCLIRWPSLLSCGAPRKCEHAAAAMVLRRVDGRCSQYVTPKSEGTAMIRVGHQLLARYQRHSSNPSPEPYRLGNRSLALTREGLRTMLALPRCRNSSLESTGYGTALQQDQSMFFAGLGWISLRRKLTSAAAHRSILRAVVAIHWSGRR